MKTTYFVIAIALLSITSFAHANDNTLLDCSLMGGGSVRVFAGTSNQTVDLGFDSTAQLQMPGFTGATGLSATLESNDGASIAGPIDLAEIGQGFDGSGACGLGLQLNTSSQHLGQGRDIPLKPSFSYNKLVCGTRAVEIESCRLGGSLNKISDLKTYIHTVSAD